MMRHHSGSLRRKYAFIFGALVGGAVLATSFAELYGAYDDQQVAVGRLEEAEARSAAARIEQFLGATERDMTGAMPVWWSIGGGTLAQRMDEYQRLLRQSPALTDLAYIDASSREQVRVSRLGVNVLGGGTDHAHDPLLMTARQQSVAYSPVHFRDGSEPYLTIARAEPNASGGVLLAEVNLKFMWDVVSRIRVGQTGRAYVVDANGMLIAHPDISLVLRRTDFSELPQVQGALISRAGADGIVAVDNNGQRVLAAYESIRPLNWLVFTEQPFDEAFAPVIASIARALAVLLAGLAVALVGSMLLAGRMVGPIRTLQAAAMHIGQGQLDRRIELRTGDELETLADEINRMTVRLRESYVELERTTAERERRAQEMRIARDIQQALLPREISVPPGWSISTHYQPAQVVGGDLYDVLPLPDGQLGLVIGDVAGEGVPAALLMATTRTIVRSVVAQGATAPGEVLSRANDLLFRDTPPNLFVTCLYAVLDPIKGRLGYANAGHVPPLRRRAADGGVNQLRARGMPLGLMPGSVYEEQHADLDPGETVLFYSDGLVEAHDSSRQMFTTERLTALAGRGGPAGAALIERVLAELDRFTGPDWQQEDDLTLLTLERRQEVQPTWQARQPWTFAKSRVALDPGSRPALLTSAAT